MISSFCCCGRIEIKYTYLLSWLMQKNLFIVEMLFEMEKPWPTPPFLYFRQHFSTEDAIMRHTQNMCFISLLTPIWLHVLCLDLGTCIIVIFN